MTRVIVTGLIAQHRWMGGVAWDYLNVLLGFRDLGHDVYYFEDSGEWPYLQEPVEGSWIGYDPTPTVKHLHDTLRSFNLEERWAYRFPITGEWFGLPESKRKDVIKTADILLNVSGTLEHPEHYRSTGRLVYMDTDPVFTQIKLLKAQQASQPESPPILPSLNEQQSAGKSEDEKNHQLLACVTLHDVHFTVGETLPEEFKNTGHEWLPTKHPIAVQEWRGKEAPGEYFTTVGNWASYSPVEYKGKRYGQKDIEFRRFLDLPWHLCEVRLEVALAKVRHIRWETSGSDEERTSDADSTNKSLSPQEMLEAYGWKVIEAEARTRSLSLYREYIIGSKGEFSVAKNGYVAGRSGWFSGRSGCYLAAGRPVIVQNTGFDKVIPTGKGIFAINTLAEAADALTIVDRNYKEHAKAAREISEEYFEARTVLHRLLERC